MNSFIPVGFLFVIAVLTSLAILFLTTILGPKKREATRLSPYECGVPPEGDARIPFRIRFYLIAVLFLLFDIEGAFFLPWALIYRESLQETSSLFFGILVYLGLVVVGLIYILRRQAIEADE